VGFEIGDRVRVTQVGKFEPCFDRAVLIGQMGTVVTPDVDDEDSDGNPIVRVEVALDHKVDMGGYPAHLARDFVFDAIDLALDEETP